MIKVTSEATEIVTTTTVDIIMAVTAMMKMMVEDMDITNIMIYIIIMVTCMMMVNIIPMKEALIGIIIQSAVRF